jgi:hypothetical protein
LRSKPGELLEEYRPSLTPEGRNGLKAEIFLYDTLPGGAGFASQLVDRGAELFQRALRLVKTCPENCEASCYRCLRSFKNKFEHRLLDRHVGAELLEFLITGSLPEFDQQRLKDSTALLYGDLLRQGYEGFDFKPDAQLTIKSKRKIAVPILATAKDGKQFVIALSAPLAINRPDDASVRKLQEASDETQIIVVNELLVRCNLPAGTREVQQFLHSQHCGGDSE